MNLSELLGKFKTFVYRLTSTHDEVDTLSAEARIRSGIWFRGTNVWILVCSVVIASVGLNVNSIPVIIGAMLISPLMGPIIGMGLSLGINDSRLLADSLKNFLVMVAISLASATVYFMLSPLNLVDPTELVARTSPTLYDILIALFGGIAGIIENSRKDRGTVISGVAIATALMPPLCTAGYGLANGNFHFFFGAMYLFLINTVFILLATYIVAIYFPFQKNHQETHNKKYRTISSLIVVLLAVPSVISGVAMVQNNNFERQVRAFVVDNKTFGNSYIYDFSISKGKGRKAVIYFTGSELSADERAALLASAERHGISAERMDLRSNTFGRRTEKVDELVSGIYRRADAEMAVKNDRIKELEEQVRVLSGETIPYVQVTRELRYKYPQVRSLSMGRGMEVRLSGPAASDTLSRSAPTDSLSTKPRLSVDVITSVPLSRGELEEIATWLRMRLNDTTVVVRNPR